MKQILFWGSVLIGLICVNTLAAVLYANVTPLDTGGGFISLSPLIDCVLWGFIITVCAAAAFLTRRRRFDKPIKIPEPLRFPLAWLGVLAGFSVVILILGWFDLLYPYGRFQIPMPLYLILIVSGYLAGGFLFGRKDTSRFYWGLLWTVLLPVLLVYMGGCLLHEANGDILGRLCLPFCLMLESYHDELKNIPRETQVMLACLCPVLLFTAGWLAGRLCHKGRSI